MTMQPNINSTDSSEDIFQIPHLNLRLETESPIDTNMKKSTLEKISIHPHWTSITQLKKPKNSLFPLRKT